MSDEVGGWYSVRCVFRHGSATPTTYEERITLWQADNLDHAIALAEAEANEYVETISAEYLGLAQAYKICGQPGHGGEVYSLMRDSPLEPTAYLDTFFDNGNERQQTS